MPTVVATVILNVWGAVVTWMPLWAPQAALWAARVILVAAAVSYNSAQQRRIQRRLAEASKGLDQGRNIMVRDAVSPRRVIYGQVEVSGSVPFIHTAGSSNEYLYYVVKIADHECEELGEVKVDEEVVPLDGSGNATGKYAGYVQIRKFLGAAAGERDTVWESEIPGVWTSAHIGCNVARLHVRVKVSAELFPSGGMPMIKCLAKGRKVYDFRTATTAWSANAALCTADYLMDTRYGRAVPLARIIAADVIAAANICDEAVVLVSTATEARYTCNGVINTDEDPDVVIADLAASMAGIVCDPGGKWSISAGAWRAPALTLDESDFVGAMQVTPRQSRQDTFNGVRGTFYSPINQWAPADFPAVKNDTYMGWDGGVRLWLDVAYRFTTSAATAQRLAKIELERGRQQIVVNAPTTLKAMQLQPGSTVALTFARYGWSAKPFEVIAWKKIRTGTEEAPALAVMLTLRETAEGVWDWADGEETTVDLAANTTLVDASTVPNVSGFAAVVAPSGERTALPRVKLTWSAPTDALVTSGGITEIEYKRNSEASWTPWNRVRGDILVEYVSDLEVGVAYNFRARHENVHGVHSPSWVTANATSAAGISSYSLALTNGRHGVATTAEGTALSGELGSGGRATTDAKAWAGNVALTPVASSPTAGQFAITAAVIAGTATITQEDADTVRLDTLGTDTATIRFTYDLEGLTTRTEDWVVWKNFAGGAYWLLSSAAAANKASGGAYTPATVDFTGKAILSGSIGVAAYAGRFKIATWNGSVWTDVYTSASDESSTTYTIPAGSFTKFRCQLYKAGGFSFFLDEIEIPITNDGAAGSSAPQLQTQYSADGSTGWTSTYNSSHIYMRTSADGGSTWSAAVRIKGADGSPGTDGATVLGSSGGGGSAASSSYTNISPDLTLGVTCDGSTRILKFSSAYVANASGSTQTCFVAICDGTTVIAELGDGQGVELAAGKAIPVEFSVSYTPSAGAHTFRIRVKGNSGNSVATGGYLEMF